MKPRDVKTIDIDGREWRDRVNGNSYFSARVVVNYGLPMEKTFYVPLQYGYGDAYIGESLGVVGSAYGFNRKDLATWFLQDEYGIVIRASKTPAKKQSAISWGTDPATLSKKLIPRGRGGFLLSEGEAITKNPGGYNASGFTWAVMEFRKQIDETERLPLSERKANAVRWFRALEEDHMGVAQKIGWLLNGSYGSGSYLSACRVLASPRMNQVAWCAITIANLEWRCPAKFAIQAWKKLPVEKRYLVNEAIRQEIADAKREGYCG